ncbi:MAG: helix-turn-helix transcriptional regulator [Methylobacterium sp.]|uniref:helix-turn-helix domain-containing protein n=1 Tax=Methylobacterium sp. TaxID=409 RepID=UPI002728CBC3|nr:helix-turn-helix transcriptional regulator [Methylobacterium sp.]MDO9427207.1 helix-turn-helix transcriptional regulator [Methylobacterium sp.]
MYSNPQKLNTDYVRSLRKEAGQELKALREAQGLSQSDIARILNLQQFTFISQLETGRARVPPDQYLVWAKALNIDPKTFVQMLMRYYDPVTHKILFGTQSSLSPAEKERRVRRANVV